MARASRPQQHGKTLAMLVAALCLKSVMAEERESMAGVYMAATLIGSISFIMLLYYFINYDDRDIRRKSWEIISSTISIFCAVLMWQSLNDMCEAYVTAPLFGEDDASMGALLVDVCHMLLWFIILQCALAVCSGAAGPGAVDTEAFEELSEEEREEITEQKELNLSCWAVLLAHITGFASINCFGTVQTIFFSDSPFMAFMCVPIVFAVQMILQRITDSIRESVSEGDDGKKDEFEKMWDEETEEAENDVMGLALSFTVMNAVRFSITGCLPNSEGKEEECPLLNVEDYLFHHSGFQKLALLGFGFFFAALLFVTQMNFPEWLEEEGIKKQPKEKHHRLKLMGRLADGICVSIAMCFSWSFFYGIQMVLAGHHVFEGQGELLSVCLALILSLICMFGLLPLDKLADQDWTDEHADKAIRGIMDAMGLLIGFSWEQTFDTSVDAIAEQTDDVSYSFINPHITKFALSVFCAGLLVPAWRRYMLPFILKNGWRYGYILQPSDLERIGNLMVKHDESDSENEEVNEEKVEKVVQAFNNVHSKTLAKAKNPGNLAVLGAGAGAKSAADTYKSLPGDDADALRAKNAALQTQVAGLADELTKAKAASIKAQEMLDTTMESMVASMKHMNQTVARIESSA